MNGTTTRTVLPGNHGRFNRPDDLGTTKKPSPSLDSLFGPFKEHLLRAGFPAELVRKSNELSIRDRDVMLVTFPRTGTTLLQQICTQIKERNNATCMEFRNIDEKSPWLECISICNIDVEALSDPRIFKTHRQLSHSRRGARYLAVIRNPEDVYRSCFSFYKNGRAFGFEQYLTASEFICSRSSLSWKPMGATLWTHYLELWQARAMEDLCVIPYEYMCCNLPEAIQGISYFIGEGLLTDEELTGISERCSRAYMRHPEHISKFSTIFVESHYRMKETRNLVQRVSSGHYEPVTADATKQLKRTWVEKVTPLTGMISYGGFQEYFSALFKERFSVKACSEKP